MLGAEACPLVPFSDVRILDVFASIRKAMGGDPFTTRSDADRRTGINLV